MYDCVIIGGGLAGLTCGIACAGKGLRTVIISTGASALHVASGSLDLLGHRGGRSITGDLEPELDDFIREHPDHPYGRIGSGIIWESMDFIRQELSLQGLDLFSMERKNHFHITALGVLKPTYLSQRSVFNERLLAAYREKRPMAVLNFRGFRDFYPRLALPQLVKNSLFRGIAVTTGEISLPGQGEGNILEFRSIDLARIFETEKYLPRMAEEIRKAADGAGIVALPDFIGMENHEKIHERLEALTGKLIIEIPNLPPSILGMRIEQALKSRFAACGGEYSSGDTVTGGIVSGGSVDHIATENYGGRKIRGRAYVLATGSFFSGGLRSEFNRLEEPVFNLKIRGSMDRKEWYSAKFLDSRSHPFMEYGVLTGRDLSPFDSAGKPVKNLFCAGSVLGGYNPVTEGSGGGVAVSTGYAAARTIMRKIRPRKGE